MRLWHVDLIEYLPRQQLLGQWRELCCIARGIAVNGTPGHVLVNPVMNWPIEHLYSYAHIVHREILRRGYRASFGSFAKWLALEPGTDLPERPYRGWHTLRYLRQCLYNLQEKADRGAIGYDEWKPLEEILDELPEEEER